MDLTVILQSLTRKICTAEDIRELTFGVKEIATEVKLMREEFQKLDERVSSIEKEPANDFKEIWHLDFLVYNHI